MGESKGSPGAQTGQSPPSNSGCAGCSGPRASVNCGAGVWGVSGPREKLRTYLGTQCVKNARCATLCGHYSRGTKQEFAGHPEIDE